MNTFEKIGRLIVAIVLIACGSWMIQEVADKKWFEIVFITVINFVLCVGAFFALTKTDINDH